MGIEDYKTYCFTHKDIKHLVYYKGEGPGVLLMHELPGLSNECIRLGDILVLKGYRVYMPLFFGKPGDKKTIRGFIRVCISKEFKAFASGETSPVVEWLKELSMSVWKECGGPGVGVIGMCLSGNFAISLMANEEVLAPVSCQPSLPTFNFTESRNRALAMSNRDLEEVKDHASKGK